MARRGSASSSRPRHDLDTVALTGGVFQNALLTDLVETALTARGLEVLVHERVPPNDGGISIGQAAIAAAKPEIGAPGPRRRAVAQAAQPG